VINPTEKIKYFLYARKSSESKERQVQSIEDQIDRLQILAKEKGLEIAGVPLSESKSAKEPYIRKVFADMIKRINAGEANGILCWEMNRLSRNPIDSATIQWLLQTKVIKSIQTISREYLPEDNVVVISVESASANQFIQDMKRNVKRGIDSKIAKGLAPIVAPIGYLNTKFESRGENFIKKDPERFDLVRRAWDMLLSDTYNPTQILEIMNNSWGMRTRKTKRAGGGPLGRSTIFELFSNQFYSGMFKYAGEWHEGKHEPMITIEEYDKAQLILGKKGKPRPQRHQHAFTGCVHCGECGGSITSIIRDKLIKTTGKIATFEYYYCMRRNKGSKCSQNQYTTGKSFEDQVKIELEKITIKPEFRDWAIDVIRKCNDEEITDRKSISDSQQKALNATQNDMDQLTQMRYRRLIDDEEFLKEKTRLKKEIMSLRQAVRETELRTDKTNELLERIFNFASNAKERFDRGGVQVKKEIFLGMGGNCTLLDKKLSINKHKWLIPIENKKQSIETAINGWVTKKASGVNTKGDFDEIDLMLRDRPDLNR
jgi:DNA invertase Pin-like site-specific DNA recombinase/predicted metal-binding protein